MKVSIGKYPSRWRCRIHDDYMNKKYGFDWEESVTWEEKILEKIEGWVQSFYNHTVNLYYDNAKQTVKVRIDPWDTWSMDYTLAPIIIPMLKQLKETKHGAPHVDLKDVPKELHPTKQDVLRYKEVGDTDEFWFKRWDWVLDEMIYAFEQKYLDDEVYMRFDPKTEMDALKAEQERISNGFRLFGKYYEALWD